MARLCQRESRARSALPLYAGLLMAAAPAFAQAPPVTGSVGSVPAVAPTPIASSPVARPPATPNTVDTEKAGSAPTSISPSAGSISAGEIVVQGSAYAKHDPFRSVNETSYQAIQKGDKLVIAPATRIYVHGVPSPIRRGLHNAVYNLREPTNVVASVMEHKFGRAGQALVRFTVNSTIGVAGLIDVAKAKPFRLPYRPNGLADVAGFYGVKPGPYFFLPLVGPTTLRDVIGVTVDRTWFPLAIGAPLNGIAFGAGETIIGGLDDRDAIDGRLRAFQEQSGDPYRATRDFYMKRRQQEIDELRHPDHATVGASSREASAPDPGKPVNG